ncbi:hypothetical protein ACQPZP_37350 [Spirillospora sp. CA-142024]|uniref:hypothetical protein n=1 Tax=Spirillospora sp. CA-142024 TaxID=3240036 RepID=UPI003D8CC4A9
MTEASTVQRQAFSAATPPPGVTRDMFETAIARGMDVWGLDHAVNVAQVCSAFDYVNGFVNIPASTEEILEAKSLGVYPGDYGSARAKATHAQVKQVIAICGPDEVSWYALALQNAGHDQVMQAARLGAYPSLFGPELREGRTPAEALQYFADLFGSDED